jgi:iron complex outermembrane receptor protein
VLVQLGARVETVTINADEVLLPELEAHSHDEEGTEDEHSHDEETSVTRVFAVEHEFTPVSISVGAVWDFKQGYNVAASLSRSERAPSAAELLAFGPHIGTGSYEIGALFALHEEDGEAHFELNESSIEMETSNNIDLTFRKYEGDVGVILNVFYNQIDNYYYQSSTGFFAESGHDHDEEESSDEEESHDDELPVYLYTSADVNLYGFEAQTIWQVTPNLKTTVFADYVRAELDDGGYLPRISPMRVGARFDYQWGDVASYISWTNYADQDDVAELETATNGYNWVDAAVAWTLPVASSELILFAKVENLTDTEARVHTSFIKNVAPRPGRNFSIGLRGSF